MPLEEFNAVPIVRDPTSGLTELAETCGLCSHEQAALKWVDEALAARTPEALAGARHHHQELFDLHAECRRNCPNAQDEGRYAREFPERWLALQELRFELEGLSRAESWYSDADRVGTLGSHLAPWSNGWPARAIHRLAFGSRKPLAGAPFARHPFREQFAERQGVAKSDGESGVALFVGCQVEYREPEVGLAAVEVLERLGENVVAPAAGCCGLPLLELGDRAGAMARLERVVQALRPAAMLGMPVVVASSACTGMLRDRAPALLGTPDSAAVAAATEDLATFLGPRLRAADESIDPPQQSFRVACLSSCTARSASADLLRALPGLHVREVDGCSGFHDSTGMLRRRPEFDLRRVAQSLDTISPEVVVCDCRNSSRSLEVSLKLQSHHSIEVVARWLRDRRRRRPEPVSIPAKGEVEFPHAADTSVLGVVLGRSVCGGAGLARPSASVEALVLELRAGSRSSEESNHSESRDQVGVNESLEPSQTEQP